MWQLDQLGVVDCQPASGSWVPALGGCRQAALALVPAVLQSTLRLFWHVPRLDQQQVRDTPGCGPHMQSCVGAEPQHHVLVAGTAAATYVCMAASCTKPQGCNAEHAMGFVRGSPVNPFIGKGVCYMGCTGTRTGWPAICRLALEQRHGPGTYMQAANRGHPHCQYGTTSGTASSVLADAAGRWPQHPPARPSPQLPRPTAHTCVAAACSSCGALAACSSLGAIPGAAMPPSSTVTVAAAAEAMRGRK